jgi:hypothetical protein
VTVGNFEIRRIPELNALIVYELGKHPKVSDELTSFALNRLDEACLDYETTYQAILNVAAFFSHCTSHGIEPSKANDRELKAFAEQELKRVLVNPRSLGDERVAKSTVNSKLMSLYRWFLWQRESGRIPAHWVGPKGTRIRIGVPLGSPIDSRISPSTVKALFKNTSATDEGITKHLLLADEQDGLQAKIMSSSQSEFIRHRDSLILDIGCETGFRRGSINSLRKEQFDRSLLAACKSETVLLKPPRQKFSRGTTYEVPLSLALRIADFIDGPRKRFLEDIGQDENSVPELFLSERTGLPLKDRSITRIFSTLMRSIGAPRWNAVHVFRRRYTNVMIAEETAERIRLGLDTSTASIAAAVAMKLGQRNPKSIIPYVILHQSRLGMKLSAKNEARVRAAEEKIAEQSREIDRLNKLLAQFRARTDAE